ncbi:MAG: hydrogenase-4 component E [Parcubacteria group bacterium Gr01-1014_8]|nr:MAG: hydrogenase-4 component E [Parcubacteria group bacterium Gr01-1014_8]
MSAQLTFDLPTLFACGMLLLSLIMVSRMRLSSLVGIFRYQSALLAIYAVILAISHDEPELLAVALFIALVKVVLIPAFLIRVAKQNGVSERLDSYLRPTTSTSVGLVAILLAFAGAEATFATSAGLIIVACVFALILTGLILLITRKDMFGQGIGFLVMENGIYAFGLALAGGMPIFVELAVLFNLLALTVLMVLLFRVAQKVHSSVSTEHFKRLID